MASGGSMARRDRARILVVEDNALLGTLLRRILEAEGFDVLLRATGEEALRTVEPGGPPIDLLIADVGMPDLPGHAIAEGLRDRVPGLRVLYMSGRPQDELVRRGSIPAAAPFVQKPFMPDDLAARVREVLA
jgi:DNA-binding response OmpR family regulator